MSPIFAVALTAALAGAAGTSKPPRCFHAADQSRGWKKVAIPESVTSLAAPASVPQLKLGSEIETISADSPKVFVENSTAEHGKLWWRFSLAKGSYELKLQFAEGLKGAKVDVVVRTATGTTHPLWNERRTRDSLLDITWEVARAAGLEVIIHNHLRERPNLIHWTAFRRFKVSEDPTGLAEFQEQRTLYYFNEGGKDVVLCEEESGASPFDDELLLTGAKPVSVRVQPIN